MHFFMFPALSPFTVPSIPAFPRHRLALHLGAALATLLPLTAHSAELPEVKVVGLQDSAMDSQTTVYDREALTSEGDGTLQEYLSRQPGVSVDVNGYISLRGMGEGVHAGDGQWPQSQLRQW